MSVITTTIQQSAVAEPEDTNAIIEEYWMNYISKMFERNNNMYAEFQISGSRIFYKKIQKFQMYENGFSLPVIPRKTMLQYIDKYIREQIGPNHPYFITTKTDIQRTGNDFLMVSVIQNMGFLQPANTTL